MDLWSRVLLLQALISAGTILIGVAFLRLSLTTSVLAAVLVTPVPLFKVSPGAAGFIYVADLLAVFWLVSRLLRTSQQSPGEPGRGLGALAFLLLVALPVVSTAIGYVSNAEMRSIKPVLLSLFRGVAYYVVFSSLMRHALRERNPERLLALQCIAFGLVACCGLAQYVAGIDLDLWNVVREIKTRAYGTDFGGGFMGLYRGAVGGWSVAILAIAPVVFMRIRGGTLLMPLIVAVVFASILAVGSRQGAVIGAIALMVGLVISMRCMPQSQRLGHMVRQVGAVAFLALLLMAGWGVFSPYSFEKFVWRRFQPLLDPTTAIDMARRRSGAMPVAMANVLSDPHVFLIGTGYGLEANVGTMGPGPRLILVDGEFLNVWQLGGIVQLGAYLLFLLWLRLHLRRSNLNRDDDSGPIVSGAAIAALYAGVLLLYGHFFLLNTHANQAPVAYWNWALFGLAVGCCRPARLAVQDTAVEPAYEQATGRGWVAGPTPQPL